VRACSSGRGEPGALASERRAVEQGDEADEA
jgi:hypothetical protein